MMTKVFHLFLLFMSGFYAFAQKADTNSIIFPMKGEPIKNCRIINVETPNYIKYIQSNDTQIIEAKAYILNEKYIIIDTKNRVSNLANMSIQVYDSLNSLEYNGKSYLYYQKNYLHAKKKYKNSIILSSVGVGLTGVAIGVIWQGDLFNNAKNESNISNAIPYTLMAVTGGALCISGVYGIFKSIPLMKKNKSMMENCNLNHLSLQLSINQNGIGVLLNF